MVGHSDLATQAKPDGYTVGVIAKLVWSDALIWIIQTDGALKVKSMKEIAQMAKDKPGTIRYFDAKLANSARIAEDLNRYVELERAFCQKTGRLKQGRWSGGRWRSGAHPWPRNADPPYTRLNQSTENTPAATASSAAAAAISAVISVSVRSIENL